METNEGARGCVVDEVDPSGAAWQRSTRRSLRAEDNRHGLVSLRVRPLDRGLDFEWWHQHGMALNGVPAGILRQRVGHPVWDRRAEHVLSDEAVAGLKSGNNILEVATEQRKFTATNLVLEVECHAGRRIHLATDDPAQSTPPDWLQGQGKRVAHGEKMRREK